MKNRIIGLDIIKIVAAILIIFHHWQQATMISFQRINFFDGTFYFGIVTELFFMVSGIVCVIGSRPEAIGRQFVHKIKRIYPMAFLSIICCYILLRFFRIEPTELYGDTTPLNLLLSLFLQYCYNVFDFPGLRLNNILWYLEVLIQCYCLHYVVLYIGRKNKKNITLNSIIFFLSAIVLIPIRPIRGYIAFFEGMLIYMVFKKLSEFVDKRILSGVGTIGILVITGLIITQVISFNWGILVFCFYPCVLVAAFGITIKKDSVVKSIAFLSAVSFEVYIWQVPCLMIQQVLIDRHIISLAGSYWEMIIFTIFVELVGIFVYLVIEKPLNKKLAK